MKEKETLFADILLLNSERHTRKIVHTEQYKYYFYIDVTLHLVNNSFCVHYTCMSVTTCLHVR